MDAPVRNRGRRPGRSHRTAARPGGGWLAPFAGLFHKSLDRIDAGLTRGSITVSLPDGRRRVLGGRADGPMADVAIVRWNALLRLATGGSAGWYEAWAAGEWSSPDPVSLFTLFMLNRHTLGEAGRASGWSRLARRVAHRLHRNDRAGSLRNIAYHYDLGNDFYIPWLDPGMTYSSALFAGADMTLEQAQTAKLDAILRRTATRAGDSILEIGCGWGSFAELAARHGVAVHGITLSTEQRDYAEARLRAAGLADARFTLTDYRDVTGTYDAVASIEMVEAVGREYWRAYLEAIARALKPGGRAAIQLISMDDAIFENYARNVDFIQTYIFPGGLLLSEREFRDIARDVGLNWQDRVGFGADYAETLRQWRERFDHAVAEGRMPAEFDDRFLDLWRYYLMYCEGGFRGGGIDVAQITLIREGI
ncbi:cyclopropane-fatty-acyl-phospholipid synthase family protein [Sphingomonas sp.]|uniref:cyclopropane-fatty-acyl-phospholipid synthase family protein n=1 Tax=Sphingomonas sp. TaxID=28214 RepID=UPI002CC59AAF|nr:cyclopropane-fatty-acyl-phospholipid synthase family protein [Sphingomonas sp.]HWK35945.1 cyclopropane-fatty-acyl-phospholipid synthase family protein [Sphingomonas sp.]